MPRYWWVNHKQTFRQDIDSSYLWSPKRKANGARNPFYDSMRAATPGDLVLSYADGLIRHVGRVAEFTFTAPKPESVRLHSGTAWSGSDIGPAAPEALGLWDAQAPFVTTDFLPEQCA